MLNMIRDGLNLVQGLAEITMGQYLLAYPKDMQDREYSIYVDWEYTVFIGDLFIDMATDWWGSPMPEIALVATNFIRTDLGESYIMIGSWRIAHIIAKRLFPAPIQPQPAGVVAPAAGQPVAAGA
jgi:hypothetical protein